MSAFAPLPRRVSISLSVMVVALGPSTAVLRGQAIPDPKDVRDDVDAVFADYDRTDSPGCALGVIHDGELVYSHGYGMANLDLGVALDPTSVFRIGSTSKQFTAATVVLAEQNGELSLDDDIRTYLPELPEYDTPITIRMLLHHTSGVRDYLSLADLAGLRSDDWYTDREVVELIARQRQTNFPPGTEHLYSNSGYFLLSQIIRGATGRTLREYAEEHLFGPLGMTHTHFHDDHTEVVPRRASGYAPAGDGFRISMTTLDMVGDGGVFTSVEDLAAWDRNFYEPRVGGRAFLEAMHARGVLASGDTLDYALGLSHGEYRGLRTVDHGGAFVGFRAQMMRFPEHRFTVICLCNLASTNPTALAERVADVFLGHLMEPAERMVAEGEAPAPTGEPPSGPGDAPSGPDPETAVELSADALSRWAGLYRNVETGAYRRLEMRDGELTILVGPGYPLIALSETRFRLDIAPVTFAFEESGGGRGFTLSQPGSESRYEEVEPAVITPESARAYTGRYHAEELGVDYVIEANGSELSVRRGRGEPIPLLPTVEGEFTLAGDLVTFEHPGDGRPRVFTIDAGRVRGIRFVRLEGSEN